MQIAPSHKHNIGIFEAQKFNFAKHNEAHKNLPYWRRFISFREDLKVSIDNEIHYCLRTSENKNIPFN